jgi:arsenate reductase (glutaredoxin)
MKIYHLGSCSTCKKIIDSLPIPKEAIFHDIKTEQITAAQLDEMKALAGTYESLFSRQSMKFRPMGLHEKELSESDYRKYILEEYTFLKRPVFIINNQIFVGNTQAVVEQARAALQVG